MLLNEFFDTLKKFQKDPPVRIVELAEELGISVFKSDLLPEGIAGKIWYDKSLNDGIGGYSIIINAKDHPVRRRFTIAHEIAHFILHKDLIGEGVIDRTLDDCLYRSSTISDEKERAANQLAAQILMPADKINQEVNNGVNNITNLANKFYVSESAMRFRLGL